MGWLARVQLLIMTNRLKELQAKIYATVKELEAEADRVGEPVSISIAYGMGGSYIPEALTKEGQRYDYVNYEYLDGGWQSSSSTC